MFDSSLVSWLRSQSTMSVAECLRLLLAWLVLIGAGPSIALGERVGFQFQGALIGSAEVDITLFGESVPGNSPVSGSFSYDTTATGVDDPLEPGIRHFGQRIEAGLSINIGHELQLSASDYQVTVGDDFERQPPQDPREFVDLFAVSFNQFIPPAEPTFFVDGDPWLSVAFINIEFSGPSNTFTDRTLTPDKPLAVFQPTTGCTSPIDCPFLGSGNPPVPFSIDTLAAVTPTSGDYNRDGLVDAADYIEWRDAFGGSGERSLHADGNNNGVVDAADYTVWRDHLGLAGASSVDVGGVPESGTVTQFLVGLILFCAAHRANHKSV